MARLGHVGLSVRNVEEAVHWYETVFGWQLLAGPMLVSTRDPRVAGQLRDVFQAGTVEFMQAHMLAGDDIAIELFEFHQPGETGGQAAFRYLTPGYSHICLVASDLEAVATRITQGGGRQLTAIHTIFPGEPYRFVYCADPYGNPIELSSHDHAVAFAGRKGY